MGMKWSANYNAYWRDRDCTPNNEKPPTFDPLLGWPEGRKERVMVASREEMEAVGLPLWQRDYCAHHLIAWKQCRHDVFPFLVRRCKKEKHAYDKCQYDDYILRMKEYEREKRLIRRKKRRQAAEAALQIQ